ncbi:MAG: OmpA family protein [Cyclobacteriaceae bacterium]|nr:OmpA family protein [Cyclobacteriaceae bacterium]
MSNSRTFLNIAGSLALSVLLVFSSCKTSRTFRGGAIGAGAGGAIGGAIGSRSGNTATGAVIGAVIGGTAGALIGRYMDRQAEELQKDLKGARVERVGEGIRITFESGFLFDVNQSAIKPATRDNLIKMAQTLNKYEDTEILIEGHTDSTGSDELNQRLSEDRAASVASFLQAQMVARNRMHTVGYGKHQPVADNNTVEGRSLNRRVEIAIYANDKLKRAAKRGKI